MKIAKVAFACLTLALFSMGILAEMPGHIRTMLTQKCVYCHQENAAAKSRFPLTADLNEKLLDKYKSRIDDQLEFGMMPPLTVPPNLQINARESNELSLYLKNLRANPTSLAAAPVPASVFTPAAIGPLCLKPGPVPKGDRRAFRYISLAQIQFKNPGDKELYIQAVNKVLNSVSTNKELAKATLSSDGTVLEVDLRKFNLSAPEKVKALDAALGSGTYRADQFITQVSKPPLYNKLLELPGTVAQLKTKYLGNRKPAGLFAATTKSGVSSQHRAFACYPGTFGSFCESYDYLARKDGGDGGRAIFKDPLNLESNGGEYIFKLPNGMNGYYLSKADGTERPDDQTSLNVGPTEVVQAPFRRDKAIINGQTCMACHHNGLLPKKDEMRDFANKNFTGAKLDRVLARYAPFDTLKKYMEDDNAKTIAAQRAIGVTAPADPVNELVLRYEDAVRSKKIACNAATSDPRSPEVPRTLAREAPGISSGFVFDLPNVSK